MRRPFCQRPAVAPVAREHAIEIAAGWRDEVASVWKCLGHVLADVRHQLLPYLAAKIPGLGRIPGADQCAQLDGLRVGVDNLQIHDGAIPQLGFARGFLQPAPDPGNVGGIIDVQRDRANQ
jgi:hypothetical protein